MLSNGLVYVFNGLIVEVQMQGKWVYGSNVTVGELLSTLDDITDGQGIKLELSWIAVLWQCTRSAGCNGKCWLGHGGNVSGWGWGRLLSGSWRLNKCQNGSLQVIHSGIGKAGIAGILRVLLVAYGQKPHIVRKMWCTVTMAMLGNKIFDISLNTLSV